MGLRPTKGDEDAKWGGTPWTRSFTNEILTDKPTRASAADQGVRPTRRLQRSRCPFAFQRKRML